MSGQWHKVADLDEIEEGRLKTITIGTRTVVVTRHQGQWGCLDSRCPHQGGPLGEGTIEGAWLRCPWHGYDYDPITGEPPEGFSDAVTCFPVEERDDGVYVSLPPEPGSPRTVSDVVVETMTAWGVDTVFGMVGHSNLGLADALHRAEDRGDLRYFGIRHEGAASFAASAYGKLTGRLAACFAIAGPGSTNLLTGLYDAEADRAPVLALSGQVASKVRGRGAFQDAELEAAFGDVARFSQTMLAGSDHAELVNLACKTALVERGVGHLVFPDEVQTLMAEDEPAGGPEGRLGDPRIRPPLHALAAAISEIQAAQRPMIVAGYGARHATAGVAALAERLGAPIATTFKAKGLIPDRHPLACGTLGRSGTPVSSWFMNESDLIIVLGASFSNHTGIAPYKRTIQVDSDPAALGRFHAVDVPVHGELEVTLGEIMTVLPDDVAPHDRRGEVAERWEIWRNEKRRRRSDSPARGIPTATIFEDLSRCLPDDAVICVDVGNNTYAFGRYFEPVAQSVLMSGYLGSIGFAFPAAMGAWAAAGDSRPIVSISGDGGFGQYAMEFTTAVKYGMDLTHVVLDNSELAKISKEQRSERYDVWQTSLVNPDFAAFAELCGGRGIGVDQIEDLSPAIAEALAYPGPALVSIRTDPDIV